MSLVTAAFIVGFCIGLPVLLVVFGACRVSGDLAQWEEDNLGIRRS